MAEVHVVFVSRFPYKQTVGFKSRTVLDIPIDLISQETGLGHYMR